MLASETPEWLQVPFITSGYVTPGKTRIQCLALLFQLHNQTINAWSMIGAAVVSLILYLHAMNIPSLTFNDRLVFFIFLLSCIIHTPFSVAYHILRYTNEQTRLMWKNLDFAFISVSSVLLTFALCYYVFNPIMTGIIVSGSVVAAYRALSTLSFNADKFGNGVHVEKTKHVYQLLNAVLLYLISSICSHRDFKHIHILHSSRYNYSISRLRDSLHIRISRKISSNEV